MKKTIVPFLTVAILLFSMSASRANTYELHITKQQVVAGEPNAIYETTIGQTASVTISSRCRYSCKNLDSRERHDSMHWQPNVNLISLPPTKTIVGSYGEDRYDMYVEIPQGKSWVKTDDILTFTVAAPNWLKLGHQMRWILSSTKKHSRVLHPVHAGGLRAFGAGE